MKFADYNYIATMIGDFPEFQYIFIKTMNLFFIIL